MGKKLAIEDVLSYLESNKCKLISEYIGITSKITILCSCGHERTATLKNIKRYLLFLCSECTTKTNIPVTKDLIADFLEQNKCKLLSFTSPSSEITIQYKCGHIGLTLFNNIKTWTRFICDDCTKENINPKTFEKLQRIMETKIKNSLKYHNSFDPENYDKTKKCTKCNIEKKLFLFGNSGKSKRAACKACEYMRIKKIREEYTVEQRVREILNSINARVKKGRIKETNLDFDYCMKDIQHDICSYQGVNMSCNSNDINTMSLDRIDSSKGEIKGNVQFVSKCVNSMKNNLSEKKFLRMIRQIYRYQHVTYAHKKFDLEQATKHIKQLLDSCKVQCNNRKKKDKNKECWQFELTIEIILELIIKQRNRCAYTGKELIWMIKHNYSASIDRIDSSKGYTIDNIQLVCKIANFGKNILTHEQFLTMVNNIYNYRIESDEDFLKKYSYCELRETSWLKKLKNKNNID